MSVHTQFEPLWKAGCKRAVLAIVKNGGKALTSRQLDVQIENAIRAGLVHHVRILCELRSRPLSQSETERLICRCLKLRWVSDALSAASLGPISVTVRRNLFRRSINAKEIDSEAEFNELVFKER